MGLTLAKIESIKGATIELSGIDLLDGTPVLDIKPYIPEYDRPSQSHSQEQDKTGNRDSCNVAETFSEICSGNAREMNPQNNGDSGIAEEKDVGMCNTLTPDEHSDLSTLEDKNPEESSDETVATGAVAEWLTKPPVSSVSVRFTKTAQAQLRQFSSDASVEERYRLHMFDSVPDAEKAIRDVLSADPRSTYRRKQCDDRLYFFVIDVVHVTCWFDEDMNVAEVVRVKPAVDVDRLQNT